MRDTHLTSLTEWVPSALLASLRDAAADRTIHLVGGALRDHWLGRSCRDFDIVTEGRGEALARRLAERFDGRLVDLAGERFAAFRIVAEGLTVDLWGRGETTIQSDLERRDLTINSLAVEIVGERLLDPFHGLSDLERRVLRATTERSFEQDPLRVLRLARFAAELSPFTAEPATVELARRSLPSLAQVARERVREEVQKTLESAGREHGIAVLAVLGLLSALWGAGSNEGERVIEQAAGVRTAAANAPGSVPIDPVVVTHALLFAAGAGSRTAATSDLLTRDQRRRVLRLLDLDRLPGDEDDARLFLHAWGRRWYEAAAYLELAQGRGPDTDAIARLAALAADEGARLFHLRPLLDGDEIARHLSMAPGPSIGRALASLQRQQVLGRVRDRDEAKSFLDAWVRDEGRRRESGSES